MSKIKILSEDFTKMVIETDEENPVTIATVSESQIDVADGYRVCLTPDYDQCSVSRGGNGSLP